MKTEINDGMKKESKVYRDMMIFCYVLNIATPLYFSFNEKYTTTDIVLVAIFWFMLGLICLYSWLYSMKYTVIINEHKVFLKTLFKKVELSISDIEMYSCKRYRKSVFYQFYLFTNDKKILINTRYKEEFEKILQMNNIKLSHTKSNRK